MSAPRPVLSGGIDRWLIPPFPTIWLFDATSSVSLVVHAISLMPSNLCWRLTMAVVWWFNIRHQYRGCIRRRNIHVESRELNKHSATVVALAGSIGLHRPDWVNYQKTPFLFSSLISQSHLVFGDEIILRSLELTNGAYPRLPNWKARVTLHYHLPSSIIRSTESSLFKCRPPQQPAVADNFERRQGQCDISPSKSEDHLIWFSNRRKRKISWLFNQTARKNTMADTFKYVTLNIGLISVYQV